MSRNIEELKERIRTSETLLISKLCDGGDLIRNKEGKVIGEILGCDLSYDEPTLVIAWGDEWERDRRKHLDDMSAYEFLRNFVRPPERAEIHLSEDYDS
jgi:hypothetical protein